MRKLLLSLVAILAIALPSFAQNRFYKICTNPAELSNPNNKFIVVNRTPLNGEFYAVTQASTSKLAGEKFLEAEELPEQIELDAKKLNLCFFSILDFPDTPYDILYESTQKRYWGSSGLYSMSSNTSMPASNGSQVNYYSLSYSVIEDGNSAGALDLGTRGNVNARLGFCRNKAGTEVQFKNSLEANYVFNADGSPKADSSGNTYSYAAFYLEVSEDDLPVQRVQISAEIDDLDRIVSLTCPTDGVEIYYGFSENEINIPYTEPFRITERTTVYAIAQFDEDLKGPVNYLVVQPTFTKIKDVLTNANAAGGEEVIIEGNFEVLIKNGYNTVVTDGESNIWLYGSSTKFSQGMHLSSIQGKAALSLSMFQLTEFTYEEGGEGAICTPKEVADLSDINFDDNLMDMLIIRGCNIINKSYTSATLQLGEATLPLTNKFSITTFENGEDLDIIGFVWRSGNTLQIAPISIEGHKEVETIKPPVISPNKRELMPEEEVTITCATEGVAIYYTLDDSEPTRNSTLYTDPIPFTESCTIKARAFYEGEDKEMIPSEVATRTYHVFDPTCNIITNDHDGASETDYLQHTCQIDGVDYSMVGVHSQDSGILMSNKDNERISHILQTSENEGYVVNAITIDFFDNPGNVSFAVRGSNTPFEYTSYSDHNFLTNGERLGTISSSANTIEFEKDYKYFLICPLLTSNANVYLNSVTITYREPAEVTASPILGLEDIEEENIRVDEEDETITYVAAENELEINFDVDSAYDIVVKYLIVAEDEEIAEDPEYSVYDGSSIIIEESSKLIYFSENTATGKKSETATYIFEITIPEPEEPTAPELPELEEGDYTVQDGFILSKNVVKINFKAVDGIDIYYSLSEEEETPATPETQALRACENEHAGYTKHEGNEIELNSNHSTLSFYACNPATGAHSEVTTYKLDVATAIGSIEADGAEVRFFDLNGIEVASPENGIFIKISNGKPKKISK